MTGPTNIRFASDISASGTSAADAAVRARSQQAKILSICQPFLQRGRHLRSDAGDAGDLLHAGAPQARDRAEMLEQRQLSPFAEAGKLVEHGFLDSPLAQRLMIRICKPVRLVAQPLDKMQCRRV